MILDKNAEKNTPAGMVLIGEIVSAVGIKGEVKAKCYSDSPENLLKMEEVHLGSHIRKIEKIRTQGNMAVIKFRDAESRNDAESLIGAQLFIREEDLEELPEDTYYVRDLIGLNVINREDGALVGEIKDVIQNGPQDIYVISLTDGGETMVPAVKEFIKEISIDEGKIIIHFIEGML